MSNTVETEATVAEGNFVIAQYQTSRIRALWTSYKRIFQLTRDGVVTIDPGNFKVTNTFGYDEISNMCAASNNDDHFSFDWQGNNFNYKTSHRAHLLCQFFECVSKSTALAKSVGPFAVMRLGKDGRHLDEHISVAPYGLVEFDTHGKVYLLLLSLLFAILCSIFFRQTENANLLDSVSPTTMVQVLQEYRYVNLNAYGADEAEGGIFFEFSGRLKIFRCRTASGLLSAVKKNLIAIGLQVLYSLARNH